MIKKAFTLSEVLITLGVIGVIAAITLPTLIKNYQKHVTVNQLKKTYSMMYQAVRISESENGLIETWNIPLTEWGSDVYPNGKIFFDQYLKPYLKVVKECKYKSNECWADQYVTPDGITRNFYFSATSNHTYSIVLNNGQIIGIFPRGSFAEIYVDLNGKKGPNRLGKDTFIFLVVSNPQIGDASFGSFSRGDFYMYGFGKTKSQLKSGVKGCTKNDNVGYTGCYCGAWIERNNWEIPDDYPW